MLVNLVGLSLCFLLVVILAEMLSSFLAPLGRFLWRYRLPVRPDSRNQRGHTVHLDDMRLHRDRSASFVPGHWSVYVDGPELCGPTFLYLLGAKQFRPDVIDVLRFTRRSQHTVETGIG